MNKNFKTTQEYKKYANKNIRHGNKLLVKN